MRARVACSSEKESGYGIILVLGLEVESDETSDEGSSVEERVHAEPGQRL